MFSLFASEGIETDMKESLICYYLEKGKGLDSTSQLTRVVDACLILIVVDNFLRANSHTRLRARDHCTSSTLIGENGGGRPSLLHTTLEGPTGVSGCKMDVKSTWIPTWHQMDHVSWSLGLFSKTTSWR